ncbi:MAG: DUF1573 domain-containing protein [Planctomycetota bacterium]
MKTLIGLMFAAAVIGAAVGVALGYYDAQPWTLVLPESSSGDRGKEPNRDDSASEASGPQAAIADPTFEFGTMELGALRRHSFSVANEGDRPLKVMFLSNTCKCTAVELGGEKVDQGASLTIPPGETKPITLEWVAKPPSGPFRHGAEFSTDDPAKSRFSLEVSGSVVESTMLSPSSLYFSGVRAGEASEATVTLMTFVDEGVEILACEVQDAELATRVSIETRQAEKKDLPSPEALAGVDVVATLSGEGGVGPFSGELILTTNLPQASKLFVPIAGVVRGDVSIFGTGWNGESGLLKLEAVDGSAGERRQLMITVRGDHAGETEFSVARVDPPELQVSVGERMEMNDRLVRFPLVVEVPAGTRPMVRTGADEVRHGDGEGEIVLATTNPASPEVRMRVRLIVKP